MGPGGTWNEMALASNRSQNSPGVYGLDIWEWLGGHPNASRIADLARGLISDSIPTQIMGHTHRTACFAAPPLAQINYATRPPDPSKGTFLVSGIVFSIILQRMHTDRAAPQADCDPIRTRTLAASGANDIATLRERTLARPIKWVTLPGISSVYRSGSTFGNRTEPILIGGGEITRLSRMRGRAHISAGNLIADFTRFRATLQSFS